MSKFSEEELIMIALILDEEEEINSKKRKRKRTLWVHDLWKKREQEGEFLNLYNGLVDDEQKFYEYDGKLTYVRDNIQTSEDHSTPINLMNISVQGGNATREAFGIRETYKNFFNSPCGSIPWQNNV